MVLSARMAYLANEPGPKMLLEMLAHLGLAEIPGTASNLTILAWAKEAGAYFGPGDKRNYYNNDDTPWCALAMTHCAIVAGKKLPPDPLRAASWAKFGIPVAKPMLGDVVVFPHHVALYAGETATTWVLAGGNQGDKVSIIDWAKATKAIAYRRPIYINQPANVRAILLNSAGPVGAKIV